MPGGRRLLCWILRRLCLSRNPDSTGRRRRPGLVKWIPGVSHQPVLVNTDKTLETGHGLVTIFTTKNTIYELQDGICIAVTHHSGMRQSSNEALNRRLAGYVDESGDIRSLAKEPVVGKRIVFACPKDYLVTSPIVTVAHRLRRSEPGP